MSVGVVLLLVKPLMVMIALLFVSCSGAVCWEPTVVVVYFVVVALSSLVRVEVMFDELFCILLDCGVDGIVLDCGIDGVVLDCGIDGVVLDCGIDGIVLFGRFELLGRSLLF